LFFFVFDYLELFKMPASEKQQSKGPSWIAIVLIAGMLIGLGIGVALFYHPDQEPDVTVPSQPRDLVGISGIGNITLTWAIPSDDGGSQITGYNLYREFEGDPSLLTTLGASALSYIDTTGIPGTIYGYFVQAINSAGAGTNSTEVYANSVDSAPVTPTGMFIGDPVHVTVGYKLTFGVFAPSTNFTDCKVVVTVDGIAFLAQSIVIAGNAFVAPSTMAITWADLATDGAFNVGDYLTITGGTLEAPTDLPAGSYVVTIIFTSTGGAICSQMWMVTAETPQGSFTGTPQSVSITPGPVAGYKLTFGSITPSTKFIDCKVVVTVGATASAAQTIVLFGNNVASTPVTSVRWTDLASDGMISTGDYLTISGGTIATPVALANGSYTVTILFTSTGGSICSQSWTF
jgi:hypothetical protein